MPKLDPANVAPLKIEESPVKSLDLLDRGILNLRIKRARELVARLDQLLGTTSRMSDEASSATWRRWTETHIGFPSGRVAHGNGPGVQAIVRSDRVHKPTAGIPGQRKQR